MEITLSIPILKIILKWKLVLYLLCKSVWLCCLFINIDQYSAYYKTFLHIVIILADLLKSNMLPNCWKLLMEVIHQSLCDTTTKTVVDTAVMHKRSGNNFSVSHSDELLITEIHFNLYSAIKFTIRQKFSTQVSQIHLLAAETENGEKNKLRNYFSFLQISYYSNIPYMKICIWVGVKLGLFLFFLIPVLLCTVICASLNVSALYFCLWFLYSGI